MNSVGGFSQVRKETYVAQVSKFRAKKFSHLCWNWSQGYCHTVRFSLLSKKLCRFSPPSGNVVWLFRNFSFNEIIASLRYDKVWKNARHVCCFTLFEWFWFKTKHISDLWTDSSNDYYWLRSTKTQLTHLVIIYFLISSQLLLWIPTASTVNQIS